VAKSSKRKLEYQRRYYRENYAYSRKYQKARNAEQREERLIACFEYLVGAQCVDCGYAEDIRALEFDHIPGRGIKRATIAGRLFSSREWLEEELDKCEVVCSNCHAIRTAERQDSEKHSRP